MPNNISPALFDVKPKKGSGVLAREVDLRKRKPVEEPMVVKKTPTTSLTSQILANAPRASMRDVITEEVERALGEPNTSVAQLAGVTVHAPKQTKPKIQPIRTSLPPAKQPEAPAKVRLPEGPSLPVPVLTAGPDEHTELKQFWSAPAATLTVKSSPAAREVEVLVAKLQKPASTKRRFSRRQILGFSIGGACLAVFAIAAFTSHGFFAKQNVLQNSAHAVENLNEAKHDLESLNFTGAADRFALAADDFDRASNTLSSLGASFLSIFGNFPGIRKVNTANNLVDAGHDISTAGENLALAFSSLYKVSFFEEKSIAKPIQDFQQVLRYADSHINHANKLLAAIDVDTIPEDKRKLFEEFRSKIPDFQRYISSAIEYSDYLLGIVGTDTPKTYVVLLQNTSERRPTGGFPGTYAVIGFDQGVLKKVLVDDVYNIDGQIKENRIPPSPLAHITPNFGMRDANWFADFPTSARKVEEYYRLDGGAKLDGVFAITPTVIAKILTIIGPVEVPEQHLTLTADNFLAQIQDQVEYKADRAQPKKIVSDFQPRFFAKLAAADKDHWLAIMKVLFQSVEEKHILAYFNDKDLEAQALQHGFAGALSRDSGDYIQVNFSNVRGSKSDAVTSNTLNLATTLTSNAVAHTLTVTRTHHGGTSPYGFYNRENPAYVKVYLPEGATFTSIEGNSTPDYKPLIDFAALGFKEDPDVAALENKASHPAHGVDVFEESGKIVVGYWQVTKPGKTSTVTLAYTTPASGRTYALYWQKQSGSDGDTMHWAAKVPAGMTLTSRDPNVQVIGDNLIVDAVLDTDQTFKVGFGQ